MAWGKVTFRVINAEFIKRKDGTVVELSKGSDGFLYLRFHWPTNEHGKKKFPTSMRVDTLRYLMGQSDCINLAIDKADQSAAAIRLIEAEKTAYEADIVALNAARSAVPDMFTDEVYQKRVDLVHAKYPNLFPRVTDEVEADEVEADEVESEA